MTQNMKNWVVGKNCHVFCLNFWTCFSHLVWIAPNRYEFSIKIHYIPINPICKDFVDISTGFLNSSDVDCSWVITAPLGSTISIHLQIFEVNIFVLLTILFIPILLKRLKAAKTLSCAYALCSLEVHYWKFFVREAEALFHGSSIPME